MSGECQFHLRQVSSPLLKTLLRRKSAAPPYRVLRSPGIYRVSITYVGARPALADLFTLGRETPPLLRSPKIPGADMRRRGFFHRDQEIFPAGAAGAFPS